LSEHAHPGASLLSYWLSNLPSVRVCYLMFMRVIVSRSDQLRFPVYCTVLLPSLSTTVLACRVLRRKVDYHTLLSPSPLYGAKFLLLVPSLQFAERHPAAAEVFYGYLHEFVSVGHVAKLATVLFTFLVTAAARSSRATAVEHDQGDAKGEEAEAAVAGKRRRAAKVCSQEARCVCNPLVGVIPLCACEDAGADHCARVALYG
jgi:hypothetical protein